MLSFGPNKFNLVYIDPEFEDERFQRIIAVRELEIVDNEFLINAFENTIPKPGSEAFDKLASEGYELPLSLQPDEKFKEKANNLKRKIAQSYKWKYVTALHVHHTYYQSNLKPWEYQNDSLQTLCWVCHENLHKTQAINYLDENGLKR